MNTEKMTVHRALAELKTIDSRIYSKIINANYCRSNKHSNKKINGMPIEDFKQSVVDDYKSIVTMTNRRNAMKRAVVLSNAKTSVAIDGVTYTVAEAIEMKNHGIENMKRLLSQLEAEYTSAINDVNRRNGEELEKSATNYVTGLFSSKDVKGLGEEAEAAKKTYIENNTYDMIDPLNAKEKIDEIRGMIDTFMAEVDAALSVSNAVTEIEFSYEVM